MSYRRDIDGLRAVAIAAVVAFHSFPARASGGYAGVDVFFVISGYLISVIILGQVAQGRFSLWGFYANRIRRIFPALLVALTGALACGWLVLLQDEFQRLGRYSWAGAVFYSNFALLDDSGYFDSQADLKPLLHLWSLAIEEQFYLVWPWLLLGLARWKRLTVIGPALLLLGSFADNVLHVDHEPIATFYLPQMRFWELLIGGLLGYLYTTGRATLGEVLLPTPGATGRGRWVRLVNHVSGILGAAMIATAILVLDKRDAFPGWWALLPTVGAFCAIGAGPDACINRHLLARRPCVWLGLISYPLYLWHWPVLSYARIVLGGELRPGIASGLVAGSVLLAWLTYRFVERPIRFGVFAARADRRVSARIVPAGLASGMALLALVGIAIERGVVRERLSDFRYLTQARRDWSDVLEAELPGGSETNKVMLIGDSYAQQYLPRLEELAREHPGVTRGVVFRAAPGCAPIPGIERKSIPCHKAVVDAFRRAGQPDVGAVILGASWVGFVGRGDYYDLRDAAKRSLDVLAPENDWIYAPLRDAIRQWVGDRKAVYLVLSHPGGRLADPSSLVDRLSARALRPDGIDRADYLQDRKPMEKVLRAVARETGATIIDPVEWICGERYCPTASADGAPYYMNGTHLRASYVRENFRLFDAIVLP